MTYNYGRVAFAAQSWKGAKVRLNHLATDAQKSYATGLGLTFSPNISYGEIILLINGALPATKRVPPTPSQLKLVEKLGIELDERATRQYVKLLLHEEIERRCQKVLKDNPFLRRNGSIYYQGKGYKVTSIDTSPRGIGRVGLRPLEGGRVIFVLILDLGDIRPVE